MDYDKTAAAILEQVGGASNVGALEHCSTRLRFTLVDGGKADATGKFICTIEGKRFFDGDTGDGAWHTIDCDLLPLMREALTASQTKGFLEATAFEDLVLTSFNLGWEVPGTYDCAITLKGLSLTAEP